MNLRDLAILESAAARLEELITTCRPRHAVYCVDPALAADVTRKAKGLRTSLQKLRAAVDDPHHQPGKKEPTQKQQPLGMRIYADPCLTEIVRLVGYGGITDAEMREPVTALSEKYGSERFGEALRELADITTANRWVLRPEARRECRGLLGPDPEHPLADFLRYGPCDIMGEEEAMKWQEEYRRRKAEEPKKRGKRR